MGSPGPTLFFDGHCHLCSGVVRYVLSHDHERKFCFAALQGQTARSFLDPKFTVTNPGTVVFWDGDRLYTHSTAALRVLVWLGGWYRAWAIAYCVPRVLRDALYNYVARYRYAWFGRSDVCRFSLKPGDVRFLP